MLCSNHGYFAPVVKDSLFVFEYIVDPEYFLNAPPNEFINEEIIFKGNIGRIRDIKIHKETGELYMLSDNGELWRMYK